MPYTRNTKHVERAGLFDKLASRLAVKKGSQARLALFGLGGIGLVSITIARIITVVDIVQEITNSSRICLQAARKITAYLGILGPRQQW